MNDASVPLTVQAAAVTETWPEWRNFRRLVMAAVIAAFLLILTGYVVRSSDAALACPDWPTCYGQFGLPDQLGAQIQVGHRVLALLSTLLTIGAAGWALLRFRGQAVVRNSLLGASALMLAQAALGAGLVLFQAGEWMSTVHLALAMVALALLLVAVVGIFLFKSPLEVPSRLVFRSPFTRLAAATLLVLFVIMVSGVLLTGLGSSAACAGWPLCDGALPGSGAAWLAFAHRIITGIGGILVIVLLVHAWRTQRSQATILTGTTAAFVLFAGQVLVGALKVSRDFPLDLIGLHAAVTAGLWGVLVVVVAAAAWKNRPAAEEAAEGLEAREGVRAHAKDFLLLTKPIIVALLLVTTYAGMVVGGKGIPSLSLTFWTLLGGALAAGGSGALNQYIDRMIDGSMQRTANRPLPAGRLLPAEALAFGVAACLVAFFLLAGFVNLLAAVLSFAGMVYYVLLYSLWLKHATVQNIVIGGGAGAIPPLVGWAAASGSLNVPSLFLFALVFLWTPPHFWALALVRQKDYARAGVPMLPVVRGEKVTRSQIFIYTLELVALTLVMPLFGIGGSLYLVLAAALGLWLISAAWQVLKKPGNKVAWRMYRYSSMYLAFIFLALVVDVLILKP